MEYIKKKHLTNYDYLVDLWIHLKWSCSIDTSLPIHPSLHPLPCPYLYLHVTQVNLRDLIQQVEDRILCQHHQIEEIICADGLNSAVHYLTNKLNDTVCQCLEIQEKITVITENQIILEHQLKHRQIKIFHMCVHLI